MAWDLFIPRWKKKRRRVSKTREGRPWILSLEFTGVRDGRGCAINRGQHLLPRHPAGEYIGIDVYPNYNQSRDAQSYYEDKIREQRTQPTRTTLYGLLHPRPLSTLSAICLFYHQHIGSIRYSSLSPNWKPAYSIPETPFRTAVLIIKVNESIATKLHAALASPNHWHIFQHHKVLPEVLETWRSAHISYRSKSVIRKFEKPEMGLFK